MRAYLFINPYINDCFLSFTSFLLELDLFHPGSIDRVKFINNPMPVEIFCNHRIRDFRSDLIHFVPIAN